MIAPLSSWKKRILKRLGDRPVLAVDFGDSSTKIVRMMKKEGAPPQITPLLYPEPVPADPPSVQRFSQFLATHHVTGMETAAGVTDPSFKMVRLDLPKMPDFDLKEAVRWQLRDQIEGPPEDYSFRYTLLDEYPMGEGTRLALMAYLLRKETIRQRTALLRRLSLKPVLLEPSPVSLLAAVDRVTSWERGVMLGLIDLGQTHADFYAIGEGKLFFVRSLVELSGEAVGKMAAQELGVSDEQARTLLKEMSHTDTPEAGSLFTLFCRRLSVEIQRSLDAFSITYQRRKIDKILFAGGLSGLPGLLDFVAKNVGIRAEMVPPAEGWPGEAPDPFLFATAVGLALHGCEEGAG